MPLLVISLVAPAYHSWRDDDDNQNVSIHVISRLLSISPLVIIDAMRGRNRKKHNLSWGWSWHWKWNRFVISMWIGFSAVNRFSLEMLTCKTSPTMLLSVSPLFIHKLERNMIFLEGDHWNLSRPATIEFNQNINYHLFISPDAMHTEHNQSTKQLTVLRFFKATVFPLVKCKKVIWSSFRVIIGNENWTLARRIGV